MGQVYSTSQAAKLLGISEGSIRNYTSGPFALFYAEFFSAGARPEKGQPRALSEHDLSLLGFIRSRTAAGASHETIAAQIAAGELDTWSPPEPGQAQSEAPSWEQPKRKGEDLQPPPLALMVQTLAGELASAREREAAAHAQEQELWARIVEAEKRAAVAEAQLTALQSAAARPWYRRLFGG